VDFSYPKPAEDFREEVRTWLAQNLDSELAMPLRPNRGPSFEDLDLLRRWNAKLADAGYAAIAWPREYGGRDAGLMEQVVLAEEMARANAPGPVNFIGVPNIAPAIMAYGSEQQKLRFLSRMLRGDDIWCQGFSEPDAGSDLASLRTSATVDGDEFVVNGQKIWTTLGHVADYCELLVRTDPSAPKHQGITCLLVDMSLPGIEVRPLRNIGGDNEFNELFFSNVRVPVSSMLGPLNEGWRVAMATLTNERAGVVSLHLSIRKHVQRLFELARSTPRGDHTAADDPMIRQMLAKVYLEAEYMKLLSDRAISTALHGKPSGPESSLGKLLWSYILNHVADAAGAVLGPDASSGEWGWERVTVRSATIAGGTTEVNKNIIAQRVLGLPRSY
jgi:alkylation response protein AidB-like acyl-CoA dehydrogenase